jgi:hypothetical protein
MAGPRASYDPVQPGVSRLTNGERRLHHHIETLVADPARWQTLLVKADAPLNG